MGAKSLFLGSIIWFILIIVLTIPLVILFIWKVTVILIVNCTRKNVRVLSYKDTHMISQNGSDKTIVNVGLACFVDGTVSLENLQTKFSEKFLGFDDEGGTKYKYEKLHSNLVSYGGLQFSQILPKMDINDLIHVENLKGDQIIEDFLSEWLMTDYKKNSPFWEIVLVPLKSSNQTVVALKIHHVFADGYTLGYILDKLTENTSPYLVKDFNESYTAKVSQVLQAPCHLNKLVPPDPRNNPFECILEDKFRWSMAFTRLDLGLLKKIRRHNDVQFSVLMLSLISSVLRKYLIETKSRTLDQLPSHFAMSTSTGWPNHPSKIPSSSFTDRMCNHWGRANVQVAIRSDNPLERLLETQRSYKEFEDSGMTKLMQRFILPAAWVLPPSFLSSLVKAKGTVGVYSTTVGGNYYKLGGKCVSKIHPLAAIKDLTPYIPFAISTFSHGNNLDVTFGVNSQHFPNREILNRLVTVDLPLEIERIRILNGIQN